ncbi:hypothetical protein QM027_02200 [Campylobacter concisus]
MLDILSEEHAESKFTKLATLDYADYLYKIGRQKEALSDYEKVLYSTNDIDLASRAALSLADANIDKEKFDEAKKFVLKIANANENFHERSDKIDEFSLYICQQRYARRGC